MKNNFVLLSFLSFFALQHASAEVKKYTVTPNLVHNGFVTQRVLLKAYVMPVVSIADQQYTPIAKLPKGADSASSSSLNIIMAMELKKPFALVQIPAYSKSITGQLQQIASFTLDITEDVIASPQLLKSRGSSAPSSVLASGSWHKIAVPARGVYKIDFAFLQSKLGLSGNVASSSIRLYGNGGQMLSEDNKIARPDDLVENAISMTDGGDGTFASGDYFTFYAAGPTAWQKDSSALGFIHQKNIYADSAYYFITVDGGSGAPQRMTIQSGSPAANVTVTDFNDYQVYEEDLVNPGHFGKEWLGGLMGNLVTGGGLSKTVTFNTGSITSNIRAKAAIASRSSAAGSTINISCNGQDLGNTFFGSVALAEDTNPYDARLVPLDFSTSGSTANFLFSYTPTVNDGVGYINYLAINYRRMLSYSGSALSFRDWNSVGVGKVANFKIDGATAGMQVWDVTDPLQPVRMTGLLSGSIFSFSQDASRLHEYVAMDAAQAQIPAYVGAVANQNIHGSPQPGFIIITNPAFLDAANKLADFHRQHDGQTVLVATTDQVYNEFSSGGQDISAIRDLARLFYLRAGTDTALFPHNLLLFGDASYDYKNRVAANTNFVPTFETRQSVDISSSYVVDEFFVMLDDNENIEDASLANTLDAGIGRIPVQSSTEAEAVVAKIIGYKSAASFGPWRLNNTYIGDNEDGAGNHLADAETMLTTVTNRTGNLYNNGKIYLDNLPFISTPAGVRCPDGTKALNDAIYRGTFLINFNGHGNPTALTHERILTMNDLNNWKNINKLPFIVTATCDFARYDNPSLVSAGERLVVKPDGGAIAMLTTTAPVYASYNEPINVQFLANQFDESRGSDRLTFGEAFRRGKNETYVTRPQFTELYNNRAFILLGDPALVPNFPNLDNKVQTDSIVDAATNLPADTIQALGAYRIAGSVSDAADQVMTGFNGRAYVTIYDKARIIDLTTKETNTRRVFTMQDNVVFKGQATVTNGLFAFTFIAPKDLNYDFGNCKISYYAENGETDAAGTDTTALVGGFSKNPIVDNDGPKVQAYMNDTLFRNGAITGSNSLLYVKLEDETGINFSGNSVGHDITAILDGDVANPQIMNEYYVTAANTYKRGYVSFPVTGLSEGKHTYTVTAWDVNNNSGVGTVDFEVVNGNVVRVNNLMNYPNPFQDVTHFVFEHNHPGEVFSVQIGIFSADGRMVTNLTKTFTPSGSHSNELVWDGTDGRGARLPSGVYPYKMVLTTEKGIQETAYQKLVIIR